MHISRPETYRRRLPHLHLYGATFSLTWRLHNSLPKEILTRLKAKKDKDLKAIQLQNLTPSQLEHQIGLIQSAHYLELDDLMDRIQSGPRWLNQSHIARIVVDQLRRYDGLYYQLDTFCIMPNHVHVLMDFSIQLPENEGDFNESAYVNVDRVMQSIKGASSYYANKILGRNGAFWEKETWDRYIRNEKHYWNVRHYIMNNPVKAGICKRKEDFPFSWEREERGL